MSNSSTINIDIKVDDQGAVSTLKQFGNEVESAGKKGTLSLGSMTSAAAGVVAATGALVAAGGALVLTSAREAKEMENLARLAKIGSGEFKELAFATEAIGISADKFAEINKDVQDKLGDFIATGGGEFADFFENVAPKVGLTADELQRMSGPDVLVAVKNAMDQANISAAQQVFYMESIADDASLLNPLLEKNGQALKEYAARAKELGVSLSEVDNQKLKEASFASAEASAAFGGLKNAIAAEFAPLVTDAMRGLTDLMVDWRDDARELAGYFVNVGQSFQGWKAVFDGRLTFFEFAKMDSEEFDGWLLKNKGSMETLSSIGAETQKGFRNEINLTNDALKYQEEARQKILQEHKTAAEAQASAEKEMYEEAGFGAEAYFNAEATELVQKASRWQKAGADTYAVEQWLYGELGKLSQEAYSKGEIAAGQAMDAMQAQSRTLVDQYGAANTAITEQLDAVGVKVDMLSGSQIDIHAFFDGGMVATGIDALIAKFAELRAAAAAAPVAPDLPSSSSSETIRKVAEQKSNAASSSSSRPSGSYENTDSSMSASEVAAAEADYYGNKRAAGGATIINNTFNQQISRSDVNSIISEQRRRESRR